MHVHVPRGAGQQPMSDLHLTQVLQQPSPTHLSLYAATIRYTLYYACKGNKSPGPSLLPSQLERTKVLLLFAVLVCLYKEPHPTVQLW